jgi:drug/metabolite transporter (DMT)-like permease
VLFFGLAGVLGRLTGLPAPLIVLGRVLFGGLALSVVVSIQRLSLRPKRSSDALVLCAQGVLLAAHWTAFFQSINVSSVAIGLLSFSTFPLFTAALEAATTHQSPNGVQLLAACAVLGGICLLVPSLSLANATTAGIAWGLLAGATFAILSTTNRRLGRTYSSVVISLYQEGVATLVLLPLAFVLPHAALLFQPRTLLLLVVLGVFCTALAHTLFIAGLRTVTAQLASLIATLEPVWGIIFALLLLDEMPSLRTLAGGAVILTATTLPTYRALKETGKRLPAAHQR